MRDIKINDNLYNVWKYAAGVYVLEFRELQDDGSTCRHEIWLNQEEVEHLIRAFSDLEIKYPQE